MTRFILISLLLCVMCQCAFGQSALTTTFVLSSYSVKSGQTITGTLTYLNAQTVIPPWAICASASWVDSYGNIGNASACSPLITETRAIIINNAQIPLGSYLSYVAGSATGPGGPISATVVAGNLQIPINVSLVEQQSYIITSQLKVN